MKNGRTLLYGDGDRRGADGRMRRSVKWKQGGGRGQTISLTEVSIMEFGGNIVILVILYISAKYFKSDETETWQESECCYYLYVHILCLLKERKISENLRNDPDISIVRCHKPCDLWHCVPPIMCTFAIHCHEPRLAINIPPPASARPPPPTGEGWGLMTVISVSKLWSCKVLAWQISLCYHKVDRESNKSCSTHAPLGPLQTHAALCPEARTFTRKYTFSNRMNCFHLFNLCIYLMSALFMFLCRVLNGINLKTSI